MRFICVSLCIVVLCSCNFKKKTDWQQDKLLFVKNDFIKIPDTRDYFMSIGNILEKKDTIVKIAKNKYGTSIYFQRKNKIEKIYFESQFKNKLYMENTNIELFLVDESCYPISILPDTIIETVGESIFINDLVHNGTYHALKLKKYKIDFQKLVIRDSR